jgi:surfactin synthase thioesterase subunit
VIVETFGQAFAEEYIRREQDPQMAFLKSATLFSTGHSLGGGLAHEFAYSLPRADIPRVSKVFAFDPSPVTGYYSVGKSLRAENSENLLIDRIYERGEVLAYLRSLTNFVKLRVSAQC